MTTLCSYDLNGKKLSFANWISNLSPQETPFSSMTGKESINQTLFQWQTDALAKAGKNANVEGGQATEDAMKTTSVKSNITQILRKTVKVSDTANALANYGRGRELQYQMEKAGKEIKRDLEFALLNNVGSVQEDTAKNIGRQTAGFRGLVAPFGTPCPETGAIVHTETSAQDTLAEADIFNMTMQLYLAGSHANIIMFHPKHASVFSGLQEKTNTRERIFQNTPKFSVYVSTLVDPLGQEYKLIPNRWMPQGTIYFFNSSDWTQMVLRAPSRTKLAKDGSYEKWMIEMEVGLRHRHPYASGVLDIKAVATSDVHNVGNTTVLDGTTKAPTFTVMGWDSPSDTTAAAASKTKNVSSAAQVAVGQVGSALKVKTIKTATGTASQPNTVLRVLKDGNSVYSATETAGTAIDWSSDQTVIASLSKADAGNYTVQASVYKDGVEHVYMSYGLALSVATAQNDTNIAKPIHA